MANLFADLPHVIGKISNLSGNHVRRAMISIKSENIRRQKIFNDYGVNNINDYTKLYKSNEVSIPLPHLIIIIDEFAELKREEPDFMNELISVSRVGRSLGVHLILATQKPSGTVDDNIRSNSNFRLCLRVQEKQDSIDMLQKPDAAYINQSGRCYMQVGNDEINELFQSGWSGAVFDENMSGYNANIATMLTLTGKTAIVGNRAKIKNKEKKYIRWIDEVIIIINDVLKKYKDDFKDIKENIMLEKVACDVQKVLIERYNYDAGAASLKGLKTLVSACCSGECKNGRDALSLKNSGVKIPELKDKTQVETLVKYLNKIADENGFKNEMQLWLPVLSDKIYYKQVCPQKTQFFANDHWSMNENVSISVSIGMYDDPENQLQNPQVIDFIKDGNLAVCGGVSSGKSTFLQTMIYGLLNSYTPEELNFYILDFSNHKLACFENAPHVGGVVFDNEIDKTSKMFNMLQKVWAKRQQVFKGGNYQNYTKTYGKQFPVIIVVLDNYAGFAEKTNHMFDTIISRLSKEGTAYGIYLAISASGIGTSEIPMRLADNIRNFHCLELGDKYKYMEALRVSQIPILPEKGVKGRGLAFVNGRILEFHTALSVEAADDYAQSKRISELCKRMKEVWNGKRALSIPMIPEKPSFVQFKLHDDYKIVVNTKNLIPFGYFESDASIASIDLSKVYCYTVSGGYRSGKTNALKILLNTLSMKSGKIFVVDNDTKELKKISQRIKAEYVCSESEIYAMLTKIKDPFLLRNKKKNKLIEQGKTDFEIYNEMSSEMPYYIVIDSFEKFLDKVYMPSKGIGEMKGFFENIIEKGSLHNVYFIAAVNSEASSEATSRLAYKRFVGYKEGMHIGGNLDKQRIIDVSSVSYTEQIKAAPKGLARVSIDSNIHKVILPLCEGDYS